MTQTDERDPVLELPWPGPPLRDNDRMHWAQKAHLVKMLRVAACCLARRQALPTGLDRARIVLHWQPAVRRTRDQLSTAPTLKPLVDGLVDYGLVPDDDVDHVQPGCAIHPARKPAKLWLSIQSLPPESHADGLTGRPEGPGVPGNGNGQAAACSGSAET